MTETERRVAVKLTDSDRHMLKLVRKCGFIGVDERGQPYLETDSQITEYRVRRLLALRLIESSGDGLLDSGKPQSYKLTEAGSQQENEQKSA